MKGLGKPQEAFDRFLNVADADDVPKMVEDLGLLYRGRDSRECNLGIPRPGEKDFQSRQEKSFGRVTS